MTGIRSAHGTRSRYCAGCHCDGCRHASARYNTEWRHRTGRTDPAKWCKPSHGIRRYRAGCRCDDCRAANAAARRRYVANLKARAE